MWPDEDILNAWRRCTQTAMDARNDQLPQSFRWAKFLKFMFLPENLSLRLAFGFTSGSLTEAENVEHQGRMVSGIQAMPGALPGQELKSISLAQFVKYLSADPRLTTSLAKLTPVDKRRAQVGVN